MCTAISVTAGCHYFGRNLDFEKSFGEKIVVTPKNYKFVFSDGTVSVDAHSALIGTAVVYDDYPLYFDAVNQHGLGMAGLNFPDNCIYVPHGSATNGISSYELIPKVLTSCKTVSEAVSLLSSSVITDKAFSESIPPSPLHFIISDKSRNVTVEQTSSGLNVYENPIGVLTNNPPFSFHMTNLSNYLSVSSHEPENRFSEKLPIKAYSKGMGCIGLPGDLSSASRFVRAAFMLNNAMFGDNDEENIIQCFHILRSVFQIKGCVVTGDGYEMTKYSSVCNTDTGIYYYSTYYDSSIKSVDLYSTRLDGERLIEFAM